MDIKNPNHSSQVTRIKQSLLQKLMEIRSRLSQVDYYTSKHILFITKKYVIAKINITFEITKTNHNNYAFLNEN